MAEQRVYRIPDGIVPAGFQTHTAVPLIFTQKGIPGTQSKPGPLSRIVHEVNEDVAQLWIHRASALPGQILLRRLPALASPAFTTGIEMRFNPGHRLKPGHGPVVGVNVGVCVLKGVFVGVGVSVYAE